LRLPDDVDAVFAGAFGGEEGFVGALDEGFGGRAVPGESG